MWKWFVPASTRAQSQKHTKSPKTERCTLENDVLFTREHVSVKCTHAHPHIPPAQQHHERHSHARRLQLPWRRLVWSSAPCWKQASVNEPCVQEVLAYDIIAEWGKKRNGSTWAADMPRWLTWPFTPDDVMSPDRRRWNQNKKELHDEAGISIRGWAMTKRAELIAMDARWRQRWSSSTQQPSPFTPELMLQKHKYSPKSQTHNETKMPPNHSAPFHGPKIIDPQLKVEISAVWPEHFNYKNNDMEMLYLSPIQL